MDSNMVALEVMVVVVVSLAALDSLEEELFIFLNQMLKIYLNRFLDLIHHSDLTMMKAVVFQAGVVFQAAYQWECL